MSTTWTVTAESQLTHVTPRTFSLILSSSHSPAILNLPVELMLSVVEAAFAECKPVNLALISKAFAKVVDVILYRTVVLDSFHTVQRFHRTTHSKTRVFLTDHVKRLAVTWWPECDTSQEQIHAIIAACPGIRALIAPTFLWPIDIISTVPVDGGLTDITIESFDGDCGALRRASKLSKELTYLRICEPSTMWFSPTSILAAFGPLPQLSHLQLARRANANETNDIMFANSVRTLLHSLPALKMLIVSIFTEPFTCSKAEDSSIWKRMSGIRDEDCRVVILPGRYDEWRAELQNQKLVRSGYQPANFWVRAANANHTKTV
ncbi:hypothetical protein DXG03_001457 [Asterophora parasitica]|uniref:F-box domain-containing protein n=1 Tax=Asterophora parasitica TaxID=117018 RepID=A0A9P7GAK7_9AGAR|nr:hypothetical protein DXG03_001457 [Asterophora parasitica]